MHTVCGRQGFQLKFVSGSRADNNACGSIVEYILIKIVAAYTLNAFFLFLSSQRTEYIYIYIFTNKLGEN